MATSISQVKLQHFFDTPLRKDFKDTAHIIIDMQRQFCDPNYANGLGCHETEKTAAHLSQTVIPNFKRLSIQTVFCHYVDHQYEQNHPRFNMGGFYQVTPEERDLTASKRKESAFEKSDLKQKLQNHKIRNLIVSGFYTSSCVKKTVLDGITAGFKICVLQDSVEDAKHIKAFSTGKIWNLAQMSKKGATIVDSTDVTEYIKMFHSIEMS